VKPVIPDTAAGHTLAAWLDAFNSGDVPRMKDVAVRYKDPMGFRIVNLREETGGYDVVAIEKSEPRNLKFVLQEKASTSQSVVWLSVADGDPAVIETFTVVAIPPGKTAADIRIEIDAETPARIVDGIAKALDTHYVYPELAKKMTQAIREHLERGDDKAFTTGPVLAAELTHQLEVVGHDRHVRVEWLADSDPAAMEKHSNERFEKVNCGFVQTERLDGNIGYIKLDQFGPVEACGPKATEAFAALGDVDAVIFDLRDNGGGYPEMVTYVESYLFAKRTRLRDLYSREDNKTTPFWTDPQLPGKKLATQPVYVLTAARTFSGGEAFCYELQSVKRATIVGEVTGGGAHPTSPVPLDEHFSILVPSAREINPVTKTDWEGTGVHPDVKVPADQALEKARQLAADAVAKRHAVRK
jgi:hypothetical protein